MWDLMFQVVCRLKNVKKALVKWKKPNFVGFGSQVHQAKQVVELLQTRLQLDPFDAATRSQERVAVASYTKLANTEESMIRQKSRVQKIDLGDQNTKL